MEIRWRTRDTLHEITVFVESSTRRETSSTVQNYREMTIPLSGATYANVTARFSSWSLDVHNRIWEEAINLVVPEALWRARSWCLAVLPGDSSNPVTKVSANALFLARRVSVAGSKVTEPRAAAPRVPPRRNGSRGTRRSAGCVQEAERSADFLLTCSTIRI